MLQRIESIRVKAGLVALVALSGTLLPMWVSLLFWIQHERHLVEAAARQDAMNLATAFEAHVRSVIQYMDTLILDMREDVAEDPAGFPEFVRHEAPTYGSLVAQLAVIDAQGRLTYSNLSPVAATVDLSDREHFRVHRDHPGVDRLFISKPVVGRVSGLQTIQFTRPVLAAGAFVGVFVVSVPVSFFTDYYAQIDIGPAGLIALIGADGTPRAAAFGEAVVDPQVVTVVPSSRPYLDPAQADEGTYLGVSAFDQRERLTAYRRLSDHGLNVIVQLAPEDYLAAFETRKQLMLASAVGLSLLLLGVAALGYWITQRHLKSTLALEKAHEALRCLVSTDLLTGARSRRTFLETLEAELSRAQRHGPPVCLLMLDIDHFKRVNDTYGHPIGDVVLREFAAVCQAQLRAHDVLGRLGGEEFAVLLPHTDADGGVQVAEKLRAAVAQAVIPTVKGNLRITVSVGVALALGQGDSGEQLLIRADDALYTAKQGGRNRVCFASMALAGLVQSTRDTAPKAEVLSYDI